MIDWRIVGEYAAWLALLFAPLGFLVWLIFRLPRLCRWWRFYDNGYSFRASWYLSERK